MSFLPTSPPLARALAERNYTEPTPVQNAVLEPAAVGSDLLVSSQTGSGKTVAYGLAIGETLLGEAESLGRAGQPLALIIAPTRELALQVQRELAWLYKHANGRVIACVGGMDPRREAALLDEGAHIVVGTPGRVYDMLRRRALRADSIKMFVLDEADEMLSRGFKDQIYDIFQLLPPKLQVGVFSATLPPEALEITRKFMNKPVRILVKRDELTLEGIKQFYVNVEV